MAKRENFKLSLEQRRLRSFSTAFKQDMVREIEQGKTTVREISRAHEVSTTSVYRWLNKYGSNRNKPERLIVERKSDTKKLLEMKQRIAELERKIGQQQIQLDFKDKMIDLAEEHYQIDIKKKFIGKRFSSTGKTEKK